LHPIGSGRAPYEIEFVFIQIKKNRITDNVPTMITGDKLLGLIDLEIVKAVYT
jgi:hypothetical protein